MNGSAHGRGLHGSGTGSVRPIPQPQALDHLALRRAHRVAVAALGLDLPALAPLHGPVHQHDQRIPLAGGHRNQQPQQDLRPLQARPSRPAQHPVVVAEARLARQAIQPGRQPGRGEDPDPARRVPLVAQVVAQGHEIDEVVGVEVADHDCQHVGGLCPPGQAGECPLAHVEQ